jgi:hypothetical protein
LADAAKGGNALRLQQGDQPGAPRIDVLVEPVQSAATVLDAYLNQNLRGMADLEARGVQFSRVHHERAEVSGRRAYRVEHHYVLGTVAIRQLSLLFVVDGRGVSIIAAASADHFDKVAEEVTGILASAALATPMPVAPQAPAPTDPIDLGTLGDDRANAPQGPAGE